MSGGCTVVKKQGSGGRPVIFAWSRRAAAVSYPTTLVRQSHFTGMLIYSLPGSFVRTCKYVQPQLSTGTLDNSFTASKDVLQV